ncbi:MAG TPA: V-type ATPase subunit, partial [bacterium]
MESVRQYGYINAKVRAMRSGFLSESAFRSMVALKEVQEVYAFLAQTRYRDRLVVGEEKTPEAMERALFWEDVRQLQMISRFVKSGTKDFMAWVLDRYEVEKLKMLLRAWHGGPKNSPFLIRDTVVYPYSADALLSAKTLMDLADVLAGTPFQNPIKSRAEAYEEKRSVFPVEVAIDQDLFGRFWKMLKRLSRTDRGILRRLIGLETDLKNLDWIVRYRNYYKLPAAEIGDLLLPKGWRLGTKGIQKILADGNTNEAMLELTRGASVPVTGTEQDGLSLNALEQFLYRMLFAEAKKAFTAFPLSIGSLAGYVTLMRIESRNIRIIVQAK